MKEVTVVMNLQVTKIIKKPLVKDSLELGVHTKNYTVGLLDELGYDDVLVEDLQVFERGDEYDA